MTKLKYKTLWVLLSSAIAAVCQLLVLAMMARLLSAEDLGLYALTLVFLNLTMVLQDGGLSSYLVHKQRIPAPLLNSVYALCLLFGLFIGSILLAVTPWLSSYYHQTTLVDLMIPVAATLVISSILSPYQALALIAGRQKQLAQYDIISRIIGSTFAIYFLFEYGVKAVLYAGLLTSIIKLIQLIWSTESRHQPGLTFSTSGIKPALKYGIFQTSALLINQLRTRADQLIIGKLLGLEMLAIYSLAKELINHPTRFITPVIQNVLFPALAQKQQLRLEQMTIMENSTKALAWTNTVIFSTMAIFSWPIVWALYGVDYAKAAGILSILCCYGMLRTIGASYVSYSQSEGRADLEFIWNVIAGLIMVSFILLASLSYSIYIMALTITTCQLLLSFLGFYFFSKALPNLSAMAFYKITLLPIAITLFASVMGFWLY